MKASRLIGLALGLTATLAQISYAATRPASATVKALFQKPPTAYSSAPLWVWNDLLTEEQIVSTMKDLAGQQVKQVFVHPRPGLMTPYLSPDWFRLFKVALREAERLDMNVWIYDENSYPSGFAGGFVPEAMPESRGRGLSLREVKTPPPWSGDMLAVYQWDGNQPVNVSAKAKAGEKLPEGRYWTAAMVRSQNSPWHGGKSYVDLLYPGVTEKFLEITLGAYKREVGAQFGKRIPGVFTDEPELTPAGGLPWTDSLPERFQKRWGYPLMDNLASLHSPVGDWQKVRHNYYQLLLELFIERWGKPYFEYCAANHLEFTGHYWEHEWPNCAIVPDNMAMYAWHQRPAIDILMNQYQENTHAQFGNVRAVKELSSVASQMGYQRTLCEAYGAGGWDLRFEDMKRIGDWLYVLGVNTMDQHLSYITLRGARKRDHPQSFSYHEPWWDAYHISAAYFERLSVAMSLGDQVNSLLVLEPTTTAWLYNASGVKEARLEALGNDFNGLLLDLERAQIEYDLGCEDIMARHGEAVKKGLRIGQRIYQTVLLPAGTENLNSSTVKLLAAFLEQGGTVLGCGNAPARVDGIPSDLVAGLKQKSGWKDFKRADLVQTLTQQLGDTGLSISRAADDKGILFHHRRQLRDGQLLLLVNTSLEQPSLGSLSGTAGGLEEWDLETGKAKKYPFARPNQQVQAAYKLPPAGSLLLFLAQKKISELPEKAIEITAIPSQGTVAVQRVTPNVQVLDFVDITAGGESRSNLYFYAANQFAFRKNGMERNPWDSAVQFKDELISRKFSADSGFQATYHFVIDGQPPASLSLVLERADIYEVTCNGKTVKAKPGDWWLDKAFGRIDIARLARSGENEVTLKAKPFTIYHELEPAYLVGDFQLRATDKGFVMVPATGLKMGAWNDQGMPFYSAGVAYTETFQVPAKQGQYRVSLARWLGSVAKVRVNDKPAGYIAYAPWECDITALLKPGVNTVTVEVIGTLKNTLGPHHSGPGLGSAWPGMFQKGPASGPPPGKNYATVQYGLFEPFTLKQVVEKPKTK